MIDRFRGEHAFLSNFWHSPIEVCGIRFPTVEHAYQASKVCLTLDPEERWEVQRGFALMETPGMAKRAGRRCPLREDWNDVRLPLMKRLLMLKFALPTRFALLKETAPHELVEGNDWGDEFWGVCRGKGENHLGRLLMEIRASS